MVNPRLALVIYRVAYLFRTVNPTPGVRILGHGNTSLFEECRAGNIYMRWHLHAP